MKPKRRMVPELIVVTECPKCNRRTRYTLTDGTAYCFSHDPIPVRHGARRNAIRTAGVREELSLTGEGGLDSLARVGG